MSTSQDFRRTMRSTRFYLSLALLAALVAAVALPYFSRAKAQSLSFLDNTRKKASGAQFVPGEILVRYRADATAMSKEQATQTLHTMGRAIPVQVESFKGAEMIAGLRLARVAPSDMLEALLALNAQPDVLYAEPNYIRYSDALPNDPRLTDLWGLKNPGGSNGVAGVDVGAEAAWDQTTGSRSIVVGVIDEGININHEDLKDNIWKNPAEIAGNNIDDDGNGYVDDVNGWDFFHNDKTVFDAVGTFPSDETDAHGTHVAGTIGAVGNNNIGVVGVNWQVSIMSLKILGRDDEEPAQTSVLQTVQAYNYARMMRELWQSSGGTKGANLRVLNNSYGGPNFSQTELDAIKALDQSGILFVAAAGNDNVDADRVPHYPANYDAPNLISVAAINRYGTFADFSNYGARKVHTSAPGVDVLSTTPNNTYYYSSGTSMASPHVAGIAALVCARYPNISLHKLRSAILFSGKEGSPGARTLTGRFANAADALTNAGENDTTPPNAIGNLHLSYQNGRVVNLDFISTGDDGNAGQASLYEIRYSDSDVTTSAQFEQAYSPVYQYQVGPPGSSQKFLTVTIPYRHADGFIGIRAVDNVGNAGPITTMHVTVDAAIADPYTIAETGASALSTGGTPLNLRGDDIYTGYSLPFPLRFYGQSYSNLYVSSNGALYFSNPPTHQGSTIADPASSVDFLNGQQMIAGLWDDLRTDRRAGDDVYIVQPDANRIIFRWQGVTFATESPVSFEIELNRDGTIQTRYGNGNTNLFPIVGVSGGDADAYLVASHSSKNSPINLSNAPTVTFSLRNPISSDMRITMTDSPDPVAVGQQLTYNIEARNFGPDQANNISITDQIPAGTTFVSCSANVGNCVGPAVGGNGPVTLNIQALPNYTIYGSYLTLTINVQVNAPAGTTLSNTATVTNLYRDPNTSNNVATVTTDVFQDSGFAGVRNISAGLDFTLAAKMDGTVLAWGGNGFGTIGNGQYGGVNPRPVQVSGLTGVVAVAAGSYHSLALKSDGTVWAWGYGGKGQLGRNDNFGQEIGYPAQVSGLSNVKAIAAGGEFSLALKTDGTVWAWGDNGSLQMGNPTLGNFTQATPVQVQGLSSVSAIAAGNYHCLALKTDGTVWGWGNNQFGQLGFTTPIATATATQFGTLSGVAGIAAGEMHTVILKSDGTVWTLGYNTSGQLGTGTTSQQSTPTQVAAVNSIVSVAAGGDHTLALKSDGTVWAWGYNSDGILGTGSTNNVLTPAQVAGLGGVSAISAGKYHNLALLGDGSVKAWGANGGGRLGDGTTITRSAPVQVSSLTVVATPSFSLAAGNYDAVKYVTISCVTGGAVLHYTTNGQEPTESDPVIASGASLRLSQTTTLKVKAWKSGWGVSATNSATYTMSIAPNQIDDARNFVSQHYQDFLNRAADQGGLDYWSTQITQCGTDARCIHEHRISVSAAFFIELEFQETGYFVYRVYKASLGRQPTYAEFTPDRAQVVGGANLEAGKQAFADAWVQRATFKAAYPDTISNTEFVNRLFDTAGLVPYAQERAQQISAMDSSGKTRAQALREVIEIQEFKSREYNPAFVRMQYFGYLRRDPDAGGEAFWLNVLNNAEPNNYRGMVCSFITSAEYQLRFGTSITRNNQDCSQ